MTSPSRITTSWTIALGVVLAVFVGLFGLVPYCYGYGSVPVSLSTMLWSLWNDYGDWQHGMIVPVVAGWLVMRKLRSMPVVEVRPSNVGFIVVLTALLLYWAGFKADIQYAGFVSAQLLVAGVAIWFFGWSTFLQFLFPWALLTFMWPFLFLDNMIAFPLRLVMSEISYRFLDLVGMDVVKQGTAVVSAADPAAGLAQSERFAVDIADPCSGIRSLFALTLITAVYAYLSLQKNWQRTVLFLMAGPLAVMGNFFRILMLVFGTIQFGAPFAIGTIDKPSAYHMGAGFAVFAVALSGMVGLAALLRRFGGNNTAHANESPTPILP